MEKAEKPSENKIEQNIPKKKTCIWAEISFFSALFCWIVLVLSILFGDACSPIPDEPEILGYILIFLYASIFIAAFIAIIVAFLSAIIGSIRIIIKRDILKGWIYIIVGFCLSSIIILGILVSINRTRRCARVVMCQSNISTLSSAIHLYAQDNDGKYPTPEIWCDLLVQHDYAYEENFVCKGALKRGDKGRCHYALNPNCSPNSPPDVVLLFETRGGWNQYGGPELLSTEHHKKENGCNISFNDSYSKFVHTEHLSELKWDNESKDNTKQ